VDYEQLMREFPRADVTAYVAAADNHSVTPLVLIANNPGSRLRVQKIVISVTTTAAQTQTIRSVTGDVPLAALAASPALAAFPWDFGTKGAIIADGQGLEYVNGAAGVACAIVVQAYWEPIPSNYLT
jgi:hypothetical protein